MQSEHLVIINQNMKKICGVAELMTLIPDEAELSGIVLQNNASILIDACNEIMDVLAEVKRDWKHE